MQDLIPEYKKTMKILVKAKEQAPDEDDAKIIGEMISSTQFSIDYLKKGHHPENRRGIHRRSVQQRTTPLDPLWMQSYAAPSGCGSYTNISESGRLQIDMALSTLTVQERQAYTLHKGLCFSLSQIALEMDVSKSTVQSYIDRAAQKIEAELQCSLFF
ncbi:sigma factor-like helix-turn-helix DNA-binding protein [Paenibacillus aquistagni]|uniref:RNA polymerase sigma-70 factor, ECF subfamily n=1 Tax=Paenibacillus aquistagni TaxID=1852522 RepID=A0A1X7LX64_9BACL|nr:sigma factor-like helix-turn-helix DNA-binding protein [Paenibacillus aquistagni]SMG58280.1 RNA polymerase sigma-70 factor, ECF subfamily [Paenibacillus aquistagni]